MPHRDHGPGPGDRARFVHMLSASEETVGYVAGRTRSDLDADSMLRRSVVGAIQEIGEAAARTTDAGRDLIAGVPWGQIVEMRHIIVHKYWGVDLDQVWNTATRDLPPFIEALRHALDNWPDTRH